MEQNITSDEKIEQLIHKMRSIISEYAKAKAERKYLEEFRKSKKAILMGELPGAVGHVREAYAYSHPDYIKVLEGIKEAVETEEDLGWRLKTAEFEIDIWRTRQANSRAERKAYGA